MAKLRGVLKVTGLLDGFSFFKTQDGYIIKRSSGHTKERMARDPKFAATKAAYQEFGNASRAGKLLRDEVRSLLKDVADGRLASRLTSVMLKVKNCDTQSVRGERMVEQGIGSAEGKAFLKGFDFNVHAPLDTVLKKTCAVDASRGVISIKDLEPGTDFVAPPNSTHVRMKAAWSKLDFGAGTHATEWTNVVTLALDAQHHDVQLVPGNVPAQGNGVNFFFLHVEFLQEINGALYSIKNEAQQVLSIVEVY